MAAMLQPTCKDNFTNDIRELSNKPWQFSAHLNNKGRTLATFIISQHQENSYYLITSSSVIDKILPRLKMYILRSKVTLTISAKLIYLSDTQINGSHNLQLSTDKYLIISEAPQESIINKAMHGINFLSIMHYL